MIVLLAGIVLAPLLPGTIQTAKAFAQGRRGTSPLQPYRTLKRLWGKSAVDPLGAGPIYRVAPAVAAAALLVALATIATGGDALTLVGLFALARAAVAAAAWDTGNGFALMGAARDLALAVFAEALFVLALLLVAQPAHSTDFDAIRAATAGWDIWREPSHWCALLAFALVIVAETGRQPIDNPDTHLELTMIHEGPLLEYAGRDLAYLHWVAAVRHWIVLTLGALLLLPHAGTLATLVVALPALCLVLAAAETAQAKMRILRVPALLGLGALIALTGAATWPV